MTFLHFEEYNMYSDFHLSHTHILYTTINLHDIHDTVFVLFCC